MPPGEEAAQDDGLGVDQEAPPAVDPTRPKRKKRRRRKLPQDVAAQAAEGEAADLADEDSSKPELANANAIATQDNSKAELAKASEMLVQEENLKSDAANAGEMPVQDGSKPELANAGEVPVPEDNSEPKAANAREAPAEDNSKPAAPNETETPAKDKSAPKSANDTEMLTREDSWRPDPVSDRAVPAEAVGFVQNLERRDLAIRKLQDLLSNRHFTQCWRVLDSGNGAFLPGPKIPYLQYAVRAADYRIVCLKQSISDLHGILKEPTFDIDDISRSLDKLSNNLYWTEELQVALRLVSAGIEEIEAARSQDFESGVQYEVLKDVLGSRPEHRYDSRFFWNYGSVRNKKTFTVAGATSLLNGTQLMLEVHRDDVTQLLRTYEGLAAK